MLRPFCVSIPILLFAFLHGLLFVVMIPPWDLYDEGTHLAYVLVLRDERRIPHLDEMTRDDVVRSEIETNRWERFRIGEPDTSSLEAMGLGGRLYQGYQPPFYYLTVIPATYLGRDVLGAMYAARMVGPVLLVILTALTWTLARLWFPSGGVTVAGVAAASIALTPAAASAAGRVNNDLLGAVLILAGIVATAWMLRDPTVRSGSALGVISAVAILTKAHGMIMIPLLGAGLFVLWRREMLGTSAALLSAAPGLAALIAWTMWTYARYGTLTGTEAFLSFARPFEPLSIPGFLRSIGFSTWSSYWATYDGGAIELVSGIGVVLVTVFGVGILIWRRAASLDAAVLSLAAGGTMLIMLWYGNASGLVHPQGRVLLPLLPLGAVLVAAGWNLFPWRGVAYLPAMAALGGSILFFIGWFLPFFYLSG